jgi:hypothetical protein
MTSTVCFPLLLPLPVPFVCCLEGEGAGVACYRPASFALSFDSEMVYVDFRFLLLDLISFLDLVPPLGQMSRPSCDPIQ